jgi:hypothetical protein
MRILTFAALAMLTLPAATCSGGARPEPQIITQRVEVPVDDPRCAREALARLRAEAPNYPDGDAALRAARTVFEGTQLLTAGRLLRIAREASLTAAIAACAE